MSALNPSSGHPEDTPPGILRAQQRLHDYIARLQAECRGLRIENQRLRTERNAYYAHLEASQQSRLALEKRLQTPDISPDLSPAH